jgi:DNA-binding NtrC family response regulator
MQKEKILVVDDEYLIRWSLQNNLKEENYDVDVAESGKEALVKIKGKDQPDLVLLDVNMPDMNGLEVLEQVKKYDSNIIIIMITAASDVDTAVKAIKLGAYHYLSKPFNLDEVKLIVNKSLEKVSLERELQYIHDQQSKQFGFHRIVGKSKEITQVIDMAKKIVQSDSTTVLLQGESGTGKDLLAQAIHYESKRRNKPFMPINCTALPGELLESELMGHEKGSFTDAKVLKKGLFELADGGTIFLDEIGDMKMELQAKLLRFLEDRKFKRIGGGRDIEVNVRIIASSNKDLVLGMKERTFREDLFYRLSVIPINIPPLRERKGDIPLLADFFLEMFSRDFKRTIKGFNKESMAEMKDYHWPGNIRELKNVVERAMILDTSEYIEVQCSPLHGIAHNTTPQGEESAANFDFWLPPEGISIEEVERSLIKQALDVTNQNQTKAAKLLHLTRDTLRYRMKKFGYL